jgi:hypothetical protein
LAKKLLTELVLVEEASELDHRCRLGRGLVPKVDAHEAAQTGAVVQSFLAGLVGQVEPVLDEVNAQHALQPD